MLGAADRIRAHLPGQDGAAAQSAGLHAAAWQQTPGSCFRPAAGLGPAGQAAVPQAEGAGVVVRDLAELLDGS